MLGGGGGCGLAHKLVVCRCLKGKEKKLLNVDPCQFIQYCGHIVSLS